MKYIPLGGIQQAGAPKTAAKALFQLSKLAVLDYDYKRSDTGLFD